MENCEKIFAELTHHILSCNNLSGGERGSMNKRLFQWKTTKSWMLSRLSWTADSSDPCFMCLRCLMNLKWDKKKFEIYIFVYFLSELFDINFLLQKLILKFRSNKKQIQAYTKNRFPFCFSFYNSLKIFIDAQRYFSDQVWLEGK